MQGFPEQRQVLHIPRGVWHQAISWYTAGKESRRVHLDFYLQIQNVHVYNLIFKKMVKEMQLEIQITIQHVHRKSKRAHMKPLQHKAPRRAAVTAERPRL